jgi:hypothetical protein
MYASSCKVVSVSQGASFNFLLQRPELLPRISVTIRRVVQVRVAVVKMGDEDKSSEKRMELLETWIFVE